MQFVNFQKNINLMQTYCHFAENLQCGIEAPSHYLDFSHPHPCKTEKVITQTDILYAYQNFIQKLDFAWCM